MYHDFYTCLLYYLTWRRRRARARTPFWRRFEKSGYHPTLQTKATGVIYRVYTGPNGEHRGARRYTTLGGWLGAAKLDSQLYDLDP